MNTARSPRRLLVLGLLGTTVLCGFAGWALTDADPLLPPAPTALASAEGAAASLPQAGERGVRHEAHERIGFYCAPAGATFGYDLEGRFTYQLAHPEGGQQRSGMQVRGRVLLAVADRRADELLVRVELADLTLSALAGGSGSDEGGMGMAARKPFWAKLGLDGRVLGYRFDEALNADQRNFVRGLFAGFMHTVPVEPEAAWEADGEDAAGLFVARYTLARQGDDAHVQRRKLRYTAMAGNELHPHEIAGGSTAVLATDLGWLRRVDFDEQVTMTMEELGLRVELHSVWSVVLTEHGQQSPARAGDLWDGPFVAAAGHGEDLGAEHEASERSRWSKMLAGTTLTNLVDELAALLAADPQDLQAIDRAWQAVIWMVKLDAKTAEDIAGRVAGLQERLADMLVSALGAAGTPEAQAVLANMRHTAATPALRTSATVALFQVAKPSARVLGDLLTDIDAAGELAGDPAMAMLLLGALTPRAGADAPGGGTLDRLVAFEGKSAQQGRSDLWLNALANAGTPDVLQHAERYVGHADERVRGAAYNALRKLDNAPATALLVRGLEDASPAVRTDAVTALSEHRSIAAQTALIRAARDDADAGVRRATLDGLGAAARKNPKARQAIEQMAASDPDEQNREAARVVLEGLR